MLLIRKKILPFFLFMLVLQQTLYAQTNCKDIDLNKVPGKWNWLYQGINRPVAKQLWNICSPISKEFQRIMPAAPDGIIAYSLMTGGEAGTFYNLPKGPLYYQHYYMMKDYECNSNGKVQPEGATDCWIYFDVNNHKGYGMKLPGESDVLFDEHRRLYLTDAWMETDANGNSLLYTSTSKDVAVKEGYFFSARNRFPYHKISRRELYNCYKLFHEKRLQKEIARFEKAAAKDQAEYNNLSADEKKQQAYRLTGIEEAKKSLNFFVRQKENMISWYGRAMKQNNLDDTAYAKNIASGQFEPETLDAEPGKGFSVWTDDIDFYDRSKSIQQPQYIFLRYRRQDENLPKKIFIDKFCNEFNLDVVYKMLSMAPKKPAGINTISSSLADAKTITKKQQQSNGPVTFNFDNATEGQFPTGWAGMKNISIQTYEGSKWLAMTKEGYWYPRQFNKEIKDGFNLSFDVTWNPEISYYSGLFTVTLCEMEYDNAGEQYSTENNQHNYNSLYDGYEGNFNRVILWFDPYWNGGGSLTVYSYYAGGALAFKKQVVLPDFYKEKNKHQLQLQRKENNLVVIDNGKLIASFADVFLKGARYNLHTFSRYKAANGDKDDVFYLKDVRANY